jgi:hypothetical protein
MDDDSASDINLTQRPLLFFSSRDRNPIYDPVHRISLRILLPDDHLSFLAGRPFLQLLRLVHFFLRLLYLGRGLLDLDESLHRRARSYPRCFTHHPG